ncbi:CGNR zinc finger domain-containing protein (plasmid) [Vibrio sp. SS-MA-C1-2]|uniref:CGNR zinc finger domain-containing protein n=1 Tax=Vibrio sp. SS-MA-C1-2 TaxID=2908646 RepID=UPI001F1C6082|nr:CGNR zinc finger domain-containing protein [Vibrio sp. SS-MA-C1-2]UJF20267.1 CGNR zinc finger domain-containing protein [Vibrio sp. SS-MA-C1-2]
MKNPFQKPNKHFSMRKGELTADVFNTQEIIDAINDEYQNIEMLNILRERIVNYINNGLSDADINEINNKLVKIHYSKALLSDDLMIQNNDSRVIYIAQLDQLTSPDIYAINEFVKLLELNALDKVKICQLDNCQKLFIGRPQGKWCSDSCGSKNRVRVKRKRDSI